MDLPLPLELPEGFDNLYGLEVTELSAERVAGRVAVRDELKQPAGLVHGGVYASIAESLASLGTAAEVIPEGKMAMGLSNQTSFLRPITEGAIRRRGHAQASRPDDVGVGGRDLRRRRPAVRAHPDDDRGARAAGLTRL